jgi:hypothetical protein
MLYYHGSRTPQQLLLTGLVEPEDEDASQKSDPGDFGWGFYVTADKERAANWGVVICVEVDLGRIAFIENPYTIGSNRAVATTRPALLFQSLVVGEKGKLGSYYMKTVNGSFQERSIAALQVRDAFLGLGLWGIRTALYDKEAVIFNPKAIVSMWAC